MRYLISIFISLMCLPITAPAYSQVEKPSSEAPFTPKDSTSAVKIKGEYRMNLGYQWSNTDDFYWKYANTEMLGYNFRYLYGSKRYNTFNPNVYNSFKLTTDIEPPAQWSAHMDMIADPWASTGKTERVTVISGWGAVMSPVLPYWSNTSRTRNITVISNTGDTINIPEIKVTDGKTEPANVISGWGDRYFIPAVSIERDFRPIKNLWVDFFNDACKLRAFPFAEQAYSMISDDPFGLSDHHIYWEPGPWISYWTRGVDYTATGWTPGYWTADSAEGRQGERLRQLRGLSLKGDIGNLFFEGMAANSIGPWDDYGQVDNISFAGRLKANVIDSLKLGSVYTGRTGFTDWGFESLEQAYGLDGTLQILPELTLESEIAQSYAGTDVNSIYKTEIWGEALTARLHYNSIFDIGRTDYKAAYTYMADDFQPPLATYTNTRNDQSWSNHIEFGERSSEDKAIRIGDGIDGNRNVFSIRNSTSLFEDGLEIFTDYRHANTAKMGKFVEAVGRNELMARFSDYTTAKTLMVFHKNHPGQDTESAWIFGGGVECKLNNMINVQGIFERANEYPYWPQAAATWLSINPDPPFKFFNMYKCKLVFEPFEDLVFEYNHCRNGYKYATGINDNINYDGVEMRWKFLDKFSLQLTYKHSRVIDLNKQIDFGVKDFRPHDNIYAETNWEIWKEKYLKIQYGDLGRFIQRYMINPDSSADRDSIQPDVLDRQDIIRITYVGKF